MEIPCAVEAKLVGTYKSSKTLLSHFEMFETFYIKPSSEEIIIAGSFLKITDIKSANNGISASLSNGSKNKS